jgi:heme/copper-type cytochrome/quinol oxidase subunit 2
MMDAVPGRINSMWVMPDTTGEFLIQCREYCGFSHYQMRAKLIVEEPAEATNVSFDQSADKYVQASAAVEPRNTAVTS